MLSATRRRSPTRSSNARWMTTTQAAQDETERVREEELAMARERGLDVKDRKAELRKMKLALQKTSISFGKEKIDYVSDTMEKQQQCLVGFSKEEREIQKKRIKDMKVFSFYVIRYF